MEAVKLLPPPKKKTQRTEVRSGSSGDFPNVQFKFKNKMFTWNLAAYLLMSTRKRSTSGSKKTTERKNCPNLWSFFSRENLYDKRNKLNLCCQCCVIDFLINFFLNIFFCCDREISLVEKQSWWNSTLNSC
jgi:hypothetical protein